MRPSGTSLLIRRDSHPDPQPTSRTLSCRKVHLLEHRKRDRQVILLHAVASPGFRPAVKLFAQRLRFWISHRIDKAPTAHLTQCQKIFSTSCGTKVSDRTTTSRAEMCARASRRTAPATVTAAHGDHMNARIGLRRRCPDQGDYPPNYRPSQQQVQQKDTRGITFIARDNRRKKIQQNHKR